MVLMRGHNIMFLMRNKKLSQKGSPKVSSKKKIISKGSPKFQVLPESFMLKSVFGFKKYMYDE